MLKKCLLMLYLTQYIKILSSEHIINIFEIIQTLSPQYLVFKIWCVFHTLSRYGFNQPDFKYSTVHVVYGYSTGQWSSGRKVSM